MRSLLLIYFLCFYAIPGTTQEIDTHHILLHLEFDWEKKQAHAKEEITFSFIQAANKVTLDACSLAIHAIRLGNTKLYFDYSKNATSKNLIIQLDRTYTPSEELKVEIDYTTNYVNHSDPNAIGGSFGKGLRFHQPTFTSPSKRKQIWSCGEPDGNKFWFACNDDITDIHTTEIIATVDKPLMVLTNGNLLEVKNRPDNKHTFHYKSMEPFPNFLVNLVVGEYQVVKQHSKETEILTYAYPDEIDAAKATVAWLPDMMKFLEKKTAFPFPYETYKQVVVQDYPFPGLIGQQQLVTLSDNYIDDEGVHHDFKYLWDGVAVQAMANQWFGNLLMPKQWQDVWLSNAFAQYFSGLYTEEKHGRAEYLLWYYPFEKGNCLADWEAGNKHPIVPLDKLSDDNTFTSDSYSKYKGALVLRMLQKELGDEIWWKAVQYFVKKYAHQQVTTHDFQQAIEVISGKSYQWFFDQWIYKVGFPKLEIATDYNKDAKEFSFRIKQIPSFDSSLNYEQVDFFQGRIVVEWNKHQEVIQLKPQQECVYKFTCDQKPDYFNFNVEQQFLCESAFIQSTPAYLNQLQQSKDVLAKQDAGNHLLLVAKDSNVSRFEKKQCTEALLKELHSNQYWRYRMWALNTCAGMFNLTEDTTLVPVLLKIIETETSWLKSTAITILGNTNKADYHSIYINALNDRSDRVIHAAAIALGKTKQHQVYAILMKLEDQHTWKNQNRIAALNGLQQLGDTNAVSYALACVKDNHSPRWYLATPVWDYPFAAVNTLVSLGKADAAYPILYDRFSNALKEGDVNDIFQNVQLIQLLKLPKSIEIYAMLKMKFAQDQTMLEAIQGYETAFQEMMNQK